LKILDNIIKKVFKDSINEHVRAFLSGEPITEENIMIDTHTAMKYTAVFSCIRVLSETYATAPIMLYKKKKNGEREPSNDLDIYDILHNRPNEEMSPFNFKEMCMMNLNLGGNAVCEKLFNKFGEVVGLYPYKWQNVKIERDKQTKRLIYTIKDGIAEKKLTRDQVFHVAGPSFDGIVGLSPIEYMSGAIRLGLSYEKFGVNFYKNGANAGGVIRHPTSLSYEAFQRLRNEFQKSYQGLANTGKPIILEDGAEYQQLTIKPADAQLIENKRFQLEDIARIYRVPLHLIQNLDRATNNNIEHQSLEFIMYTMLPWFKRIEENANMQLLTTQQRKQGYFLESKIDGLLRGDASSRATAYATGRQWGWLSVNDIRKLENMNPIENGGIYLQPMNMIEAGTKIEKDTKDILNLIERGD